MNYADFFQNILKTISEKNPVGVSVDVSQSLRNAAYSEGIIDPNYERNTEYLDDLDIEVGIGHAMLIVGFVTSSKVPGGGYFILKNSWGRERGDQGYFYLPFAYCPDENDMKTCSFEEFFNLEYRKDRLERFGKGCQERGIPKQKTAADTANRKKTLSIGHR